MGSFVAMRPLGRVSPVRIQAGLCAARALSGRDLPTGAERYLFKSASVSRFGDVRKAGLMNERSEIRRHPPRVAVLGRSAGLRDAGRLPAWIGSIDSGSGRHAFSVRSRGPVRDDCSPRRSPDSIVRKPIYAVGSDQSGDRTGDSRPRRACAAFPSTAIPFVTPTIGSMTMSPATTTSGDPPAQQS